MELKYIVYITTNLCNGCIYVGVHKTNPKVFDGYIGCGISRYKGNDCKTHFLRAVKKYGYKNFRRVTIAVFPLTDEGHKLACDLEAQIVNKEFLKSKYVYNERVGGYSNYEYTNELKEKRVYMFDLKGNYLRSFQCVSDAVRFLKITTDIEVAIKNIRNNCLETSRSAFGYVWSYTKKFTDPTSKRLTKIALYTLDGQFVREWDSITEAQITLGLTAIWLAISHKAFCGNYLWRYFTGDTSNIQPLNKHNKLKNMRLPILMYDKGNNKIGEFSSIKECICKYPQLSASLINRVIKGIIKSHLGYTFKYKDKDIV